MSSKSSSSTARVSSATLLDRLSDLLSGLESTNNIIHTWPESDGDDVDVHVETTTKLIASVHELVHLVKGIEDKIFHERDGELQKRLQQFPVPLDLLELIDYGNVSGSGSGTYSGRHTNRSKGGQHGHENSCGLNPDCFSRGLLRESLRQLAGLKKRKLTLEMLGRTIQAGLDRTKTSSAGSEEKSTSKGTKRPRAEETEEAKSGEIANLEAPAKRQAT